jgi:hypothetical protein
LTDELAATPPPGAAAPVPPAQPQSATPAHAVSPDNVSMHSEEDMHYIERQLIDARMAWYGSITTTMEGECAD